MAFHCSVEKPWGIHPPLRNDADCPRCGWTAPGPVGDALTDAAEASAWAAELGWVIYEGDAEDEALAA
jgi:hypothetical protein